MKELNSFDVFNLVKESQILIDGKIDNIYQKDEKDVYFQLYIKDSPKLLLRIYAGKFFYITRTKPEFPENMFRFCSYLRKYLLNARIKKIEQEGRERIIKITFDAKESTYEFYAEIFGKGDFILVKDGKIVSVSEEQVWADRTLKAGEVYVYPQKSDMEEIFDKQKAKGTVLTSEQLDSELSSQVISTGKAVSAKEKELKRVAVIIEKQSEQLQKTMKEAEGSKRKGELIYENYRDIKELVDMIKSSKGKYTEELKKELSKSKIFKSLNEKEGKITMELK